MTEKVDEKTPKRKKAESSYNPMILGDILEREMGDMAFEDLPKAMSWMMDKLNKLDSKIDGLNNIPW